MMKRGHDVESAPSICRRRRAMEHYAGIDVSLEFSSVCVVDAQGKIVREVKVASEPEQLASRLVLSHIQTNETTIGLTVPRCGFCFLHKRASRRRRWVISDISRGRRNHGSKACGGGACGDAPSPAPTEQSLAERVEIQAQERDRFWRLSQDLLIVTDAQGTLRGTHRSHSNDARESVTVL